MSTFHILYIIENNINTNTQHKVHISKIISNYSLLWFSYLFWGVQKEVIERGEGERRMGFAHSYSQQTSDPINWRSLVIKQYNSNMLLWWSSKSKPGFRIIKITCNLIGLTPSSTSRSKRDWARPARAAFLHIITGPSWQWSPTRTTYNICVTKIKLHNQVFNKANSIPVLLQEPAE